jgi:NAD(P)-dependent dehydrogenase (short-subunit alcohol dehydrogenase family)
VRSRFESLGDTVIAVDKDEVDLLDRRAVRDLAERMKAEHGRLDGVIHLVGGWRGSKTFAETRLEDWDLLHDLLIRTLQNVSLEFEPLLRESGAGRFVIVSAKAAGRPTQGNAAYAAAKAASEAWTLSLADAFRGSGCAATILVVMALVNDAMRAAEPGKPFMGFTDVADLAVAMSDLFGKPAEEVNGARVDLT